MNKVLIAFVLPLIALLYALTWWIGVPAAQETILSSVRSNHIHIPTGHQQSLVAPEVTMKFTRSLPVFPGVVYLRFHPIVMGQELHEAELGGFVLWYGRDSRLIDVMRAG